MLCLKFLLRAIGYGGAAFLKCPQRVIPACTGMMRCGHLRYAKLVYPIGLKMNLRTEPRIVHGGGARQASRRHGQAHPMQKRPGMWQSGARLPFSAIALKNALYLAFGADNGEHISFASPGAQAGASPRGILFDMIARRGDAVRRAREPCTRTGRRCKSVADALL